jgi:hypothetical protein
MSDKDWAVPTNLTICFNLISPNNNVSWFLCPVSEKLGTGQISDFLGYIANVPVVHMVV